MKHFRLFTLLAAVTLAGCTESGMAPEISDDGPGQQLIPPSYAGNFFTEICLATAPSFQGVPAAIAGEPFTQHSKTGTYYHKFSDLSIKVSDYGCSLVFKSEMSIKETVAELAKGVKKNAKNWGVATPRNVDVTSNASPDGKGRYFRIGLPNE